ncbi:MAG: apolipoprotein N-acyltransferase [Micrococcales bacterium]|nr:apolipoprotein N-acyltransferase [Micrococcales bacterium]
MLCRVGCAIVAGLALWTAFPALGWWPGAVVGVTLLSLSTVGARPRTGFLLGLLAGWAYFVPLLSWSGVYVGKLPWFSLATLEALYIALLGLVSALLQSARVVRGRQAPARVRPVALALAWVACELARGHTPFGGFPWGRLAFSQADSPFARLAALGGAPAVTFGVALSGGFLALAIHRVLWRGRRVRGLSRGIGPLLGALVVALAGLLVPLPTGVGDGTPTARIVAIQGNVPKAGLDFNAQRRAVLDNHARITVRAAQDIARTKAPRPDLVIWPENASDIDPLLNADAAAVIRAAVSTIGAPTIVGAVLSGPGQFVSNTSLLYLPDGAIADRYSKLRPVPFAEYIPYRSFFRLLSDKVDLVTRDFAPGDKVGLFRVPRAGGGTVAIGLNICFEVAVDDVVRASVQQGANLISIQTNNATFGFTDESVQQLAISRIRAIEHGRSVVHISNVGVSALITPDGTTHESTSLFTSAVLAADLPLRTSLTPATRVGPWPEWLASAGLLVLLVSQLRARGSVAGGRRGSGSPRDPSPGAADPTNPTGSVDVAGSSAGVAKRTPITEGA